VRHNTSIMTIIIKAFRLQLHLSQQALRLPPRRCQLLLRLQRLLCCSACCCRRRKLLLLLVLLHDGLAGGVATAAAAAVSQGGGRGAGGQGRGVPPAWRTQQRGVVHRRVSDS
jgi:hypothetical protein